MRTSYDRTEVVQKATATRKFIYRMMMTGRSDKEDVKTLRKLDHHERRLDHIPDPPCTWVERVRFGWHTGWIETHNTIYLMKQADS